MGSDYSKNRKLKQRKVSSKVQPSEPSHSVVISEVSRGLSESNNVANYITDKQKELVLETWKIVQCNMARVGVVMFMNLFETHPDVRDVFMPFRGLATEDMKQNSRLISHAFRVMGTVEKCLARINEPRRLEDMLKNLGARHVMYNAKVDYIDLIGPQFILAIKPEVGDHWSLEVEEAWSDLFKLITHIMKAAMAF
ncbi:uncharacterized protein LOC106881192 [Octopus bimaculoides]|uniref:Globin domain-containing protein n=1 Tax=Octopus bimaculoides TaxID=37653 RepID=A0A0L8FTQ4_OCTBM|nr:uncharacterized protein LOC106881192 [Octopus bimaculoides]|eukprot:XP_014786974.1 PREDICTED: non-symbiotic hemoglobin-like [Octopus bimaculoides]